MNYQFRGMTVPADLIETIDAYVETGRPTGDFLRAVIDNNLQEACGRADEQNVVILAAIIGYLYNECPAGSWGFKGAHDKWVKHMRAQLDAEERHYSGCVCADCSGADLTARND